MGLGAPAVAVPPGPDRRDTPALYHRPDSWITGELTEGLGGHFRGLLRPLGSHRRGGLPGRHELPERVVPGAAHGPIVSLRASSDQCSRLPAEPELAACPG